MTAKNNVNGASNLATAPGPQALEKTPQRAVTFLSAVGTQPAIRAALDRAGYTQRDHADGWALLFRISGAAPAAAATPEVNTVQQAVREIEDWQGPGFLRARAALRHHHPAQEQFVFADLVPGRGGEAVAAMALFLDRLEMLQSSGERKATRKADHAALETLAQRGITKKVCEYLREQLVLASVEASSAAPEVPAPSPTKRTEDLVALYAWLQDWSDTARAVITRRDHLIRLGIAKRRARRTGQTPAAPPVAPAAPAGNAGPAGPAASRSLADDENGPESHAA